MGGGPGGETRLLEFGAWSAQGQRTFCWLGVDGLGSTIRLVVEDAKGPVEILAAPIQWAAGEWHQVALVWSGGGLTLLYLDGLAVAAGVGLDLSALEQLPGTPGFCLGSDGQGNRVAQGQFDELYTFLRACTAEEVAWNWRAQGKLTALGPITEEEHKTRVEAVAQLSQLKLEGQGAPAGAAMVYPLGSGLRLSIAPSGPDAVELTLHNAIPGASYRIESCQDLSASAWIPETTNVASCCRTQILVPKQGRSVLFFRALQLTPGVGPQPNRIQTENAITGDGDWHLQNPATPGWPTEASSSTPEIEGFASATSVNVGETLDLYVDVRNGDTEFKIDFYRMGWYGGLGARKMASTEPLPGGKQPVPTMAADGLIDCWLPAPANQNGPWVSSHSFAIPSDWVSGVYLAKLTTVPTGKQSYIIFVVREDCRCSDFLFQCSVTTYQAYNPWGGNSLYPYPRQQNCNGSPNCASCQNCPGPNVTCPPHAQRVSFNRPYSGSTCNPFLNYGNGAGEFLTMINQSPFPGWEYNLVRWMERQGYDVTYCTSVDTHRPWPATKQIKTFLSVGHDEYWSEAMREHVTAARDGGVNLAFFSANTCYWKIHFEPDERVFSINKTADLWRGSEANNSSAYPAEIELLGVEFVYNTIYSPNDNLTLRNPTDGHWVYGFTGLEPGDSLTLIGLLGYEVDGCWDANATPCINSACPLPTTTILADSPFTASVCPGITGHSYMTVYTATSGAQVFATGSMQWNWGLDGFGPLFLFSGAQVSPVAQQVTHNVLRTFAGKNRAPVVFVNTDAITAGDWRHPICDPEVRVYGADGYRIADGAGSFDSKPGYVQQLSISGEANQAWPDKASDPRALLKPCPATDRVAAAWTTTESQDSAFTIDLAFTDTTKHQVILYCADWLGTGTSLQQIDVFDYSDPSHPLDTRIVQLPPNGIYLVWQLNSPEELVGQPSRRIRVSKPDAQAGTKAMVSAVFFGTNQ